MSSYKMKINKGLMMTPLLADLFIEASVVGIVCIVFLILFVVAGIKQILSERE